MTWWAWLLVVLGFLFLGGVAFVLWIATDLVKAAVAVRNAVAQNKAAEMLPPPTVPARGEKVPAREFPARVDPASEQGMEWLAYDEILREPHRFSAEDIAEAEAYFAKLEGAFD